MQNTPFAAQAQQVNKFLEATRRLGAQMDNDQGTTRVIYDTTGSSSNLSQYDFFSEVTSKNYPATNLDQNRFQPGEGMVIKEIGILDLTNRANFVNSMDCFAVLDFYIGNNRVLKGLPLTTFSTIAALNPLNASPIEANTKTPDAVSAIRLRTNLVIPPQVQFRATLRFIAPLGTTELPVNIKLFVKGYGKLFNPNSNY
jgi:hypothetical protein